MGDIVYMVLLFGTIDYNAKVIHPVLPYTNTNISAFKSLTRC